MNEELPDTMVTTRPKAREETKTRRLPPYNVVLENDDYHSFEFVVEVLQKTFGFNDQKAVQLTHEAHTQGRAVVWTGANDGPFYVTRNDGKSWTNVTPKALPTGGRRRHRLRGGLRRHLYRTQYPRGKTCIGPSCCVWPRRIADAIRRQQAQRAGRSGAASDLR